jgi:hypothetical protein
MATDNTINVSHTDAAQALIQKIQQIRDAIPNLSIPASPADSRKIAMTSSLSRDFVEETVAATENSNHLAVAGSLDAAQMRDLMAFAEAYGPVVAQAESLTRFLKHTVNMAKFKTGSQALTTYALTQRLATKTETAYLRPIVEAMRQKLGNRGRRSKAQPAPAPQPPSNGTPAQ